MEAALHMPRGPMAILRSAADLLCAMRQVRESPSFRWDASGLDRVLRFDEPRGLAEVQDSTSWSSLAAALGDVFPWLHELAASPGELPATVGRTVAENAPGPDGHPFVRHVESIALVTPEGELRRVSRHEHPDLFSLVVGGQGVIGAAYSVTLRMHSLADAASSRSDLVALAPEEGAGHARHEATRLLVPVDRAETLAQSLRNELEGWNLSPLRIDALPAHPEKETFLRWSASDCVLVRTWLPEPFTIADRVRLEQAQRGLIECALQLGGSFPIATTRAASREQTERAYPMLRAFLAEKRRQDPRECLQNPWYRHYRNLLWRESCEVRWRPEGPENA